MSKKHSKLDFGLSSYDDIMCNSLDNDKQMISIDKLLDFSDHTFMVREDSEMEDLVDSIQRNGILNEILVRPKEDGYYEIISGHRRRKAAQILDIKEVPVIVKELSDDEATILMVSSNQYRNNILPSELAKSYRKLWESEKRQGKRNDIIISDNDIEDNVDDNGKNARVRKIQRYIRLSMLCSPLLELVDSKKISINAGIILSFINSDNQELLYQAIMNCNKYPSEKISKVIRDYCNENVDINFFEILELLDNSSGKLLESDKHMNKSIAIPKKTISKYFHEDEFSEEEILSHVIMILDKWFSDKPMLNKDSDVIEGQLNLYELK